MSQKEIIVKKARVHNLKSINVKIPRDKLTVITGPSGSGKSSLAFDTIYVEGQRRYIESLSSYARQFLGQFQPPEVESIDGLSPAIAIDQKSTSRNPRSTVGTVTEIFDFLRVLYARVGDSHCPKCHTIIQSQSAEQITKKILEQKEKTKIQLLAPVVRNQKGEHKELISKFQSMGFTKIRVNKKIFSIDEELEINKNKRNDLEVIVDRLVIKEGSEKRLNESIEYALKIGEGNLIALIDKDETLFSEKNSCSKCEISFPEIEPRSFSFNSPLGACKSCNGLGETKSFTENSLIFDDSLSLNEGAIPVLKKNSFLFQMVKSVFKKEKLSMDTPFKKLKISSKKILFEGSEKVYTYSFESENSTFNFKKSFPGIRNWLLKKFSESTSERTIKSLEEYMAIEKCQSCDGLRLNEFSLNVLINEENIISLCEKSISDTQMFFNKLKFKGEKKLIAEKLLIEIKSRLQFLLDVGLNYLTINRPANTLSGGESQRIRLATQIGSALSGVLYVLDEPSIGLHQRDNQKLIKTIKDLKNLGNTIIVVEHDEETMIEADHIIDMGPGAGVNGGEIVSQGTISQIKSDQSSLTGKFLSQKLNIEIPKSRIKPQNFIEIKGATENNLNNLTAKVPLNCLTVVTGVSGSGKSTLIHKVLVPALKTSLYPKNKNLYERGNYKNIKGLENLQSVIELDQSPIGRTPKSNPATYTGAFDLIRTIFSQTSESKIRGYKSGRFSFNVKGGRCESCEGNGQKKIEMHFLPDVYIKCDECSGRRYNSETLSILYRGKNIHDVLEMDISEAFDFFKNHKKLGKILETLNSVGLGYMKLGQPATTLSGGEAQRLKLSKELAKTPRGNCLYILDEPTTGLHFKDIQMLMNAVKSLIEKKQSVLIIEHNLDVIKQADQIIDLGPEGGVNGGNIVAFGTPEDVAKEKSSYTGKFLKKVLKK